MNTLYKIMVCSGLSKIILLTGLVLGLTPCFSQDMVVKATKIHMGNGQLLQDAFMIIKEGKVVEINKTLDESYKSLKLTDYGSMQIYPAIIALNTQLGIKEIDAVRATRDYREAGSYNSNARTIIAYNTDSEVVKTVRSSGVLFAQVCPTGGRISGSSSLVKLEAWNWEDAAVQMDDGVHLNWPRSYSRQGWWAELKSDKPNSAYEKYLLDIYRVFRDAEAYQETADNIDLQKTSLSKVLNKKRQLYIHVEEAEPMLDALAFCKSFDIQPIFYGGSDALKIAPILKEHQAYLILKRTKKLPSRIDAPIESAYTLPAKLSKAGIDFALADNESWQQRNLIYQASQAVAYGLDYNEAVKSLTLIPATVLGLSNEMGSLEKGKRADFIVVEGDLLDIKESMVERAFIAGEEIDLDDKQKVLYRKYLDKYGLE